mmetsp:Transcript_43512/g.100127  ORF Transcript_43512/g.100127 Transcript_43512/m.100127 type:complete len:244 (+) Transcript_43512:1366-2097(+)
MPIAPDAIHVLLTWIFIAALRLFHEACASRPMNSSFRSQNRPCTIGLATSASTRALGPSAPFAELAILAFRARLGIASLRFLSNRRASLCTLSIRQLLWNAFLLLLSATTCPAAFGPFCPSSHDTILLERWARLQDHQGSVALGPLSHRRRQDASGLRSLALALRGDAMVLIPIAPLRKFARLITTAWIFSTTNALSQRSFARRSTSLGRSHNGSVPLLPASTACGRATRPFMPCRECAILIR